MDYMAVLTFVLLWHPAHGSRRETELCYIKGLDNNTAVCIEPKTASCCHGGDDPTDINVTVYRGADCKTTSQCETGSGGCCSNSTEINITMEYSRALNMAFISTRCFSEVNKGNIVSSSMPNSTGLDLVMVSFNCPEKKATTLPTTLSSRADMAYKTTTLPTTLSTRTDDGTAAPILEKEESPPNVAAAVAVPVTIVVVGAAVVGTIFYMRRRRSRKDATEQRQEIRTNNAYIGLVSRSMGLYPTAHPTIKAEDQDTNHYYTEISDNSVHINHSSTEDNEYQPIKPNERIANKGPPTNSFTTDKDPTGEDEYDNLGTQDTPSLRANNYEHITHISKDDYHSYDKTEFNQGNTISLDDEDNYNHAQQSAAAERTETDDRDGGYSHVGGTVGGPEADDQYSTMESVVDTQDGSRNLNNYFVLEKQY